MVMESCEKEGKKEMSKKCQHCGANLADDAVFCSNCGARQESEEITPQTTPAETRNICPNCGTPITPDSTFCPNCGAPLSTDPIVEVPSSGSNFFDTVRRCWKIFSAIITVIGIGWYIFSGHGIGKFFSSAPEVTVKAQTLMNDYMRNPRNADKKYKDKVIRVTGQVIDKGQFDNTSNYYLQIGADFDRGKNYDVKVDIDSKRAKEANKVREMDFVDVTGTCVGIVKQRDPNFISIQIKADKVNE